MTVKYIEKTSCDICGSMDLKTLHPIKNPDHYFGDFSLLKCKNCGAYYTSPHPTEDTLPELYMLRSDSKNFDRKSIFLIEFLKNFTAKQYLKKLFKRAAIEPKSFLDLGTGNGRYAAMAAKLLPGAKITAADFADAPPAMFEEGQFKNIEYIHTETLLKQDRKFDVILLRHVLEHTFKPVDFINTLLSKLSPEGVILLEVPNIKNIYSLPALRDYSPSFYPPYHLVHFDEKALKNALTKTETDFTVRQESMPLSSNFLAHLCGRKLSPLFQLAGIICHPLQIAAGLMTGQRESLTASVKHKKH